LIRDESAVTLGINTYRFDLAAQALYEFTWDEYCDWYLELSKVTLNNSNASDKARHGTLLTLVNNLEILLRLMHPIMPFITEELWQRVAPILGKEATTIMLQSYPTADELEKDNESINEIEWIKKFIFEVRNIRAVRDISPKKNLDVLIKDGNKSEITWKDNNIHYITTIGNINSITNVDQAPTDTAVGIAGDMTIFVDLANLIDHEAELERLENELNKLKIAEENIKRKLDNKNFVERAPDEVVIKERKRLEETALASTKLMEQCEIHRNLLK
jgi:valyl-tRNA synthetase